MMMGRGLHDRDPVRVARGRALDGPAGRRARLDGPPGRRHRRGANRQALRLLHLSACQPLRLHERCLLCVDGARGACRPGRARGAGGTRARLLGGAVVEKRPHAVAGTRGEREACEEQRAEGEGGAEAPGLAALRRRLLFRCRLVPAIPLVPAPAEEENPFHVVPSWHCLSLPLVGRRGAATLARISIEARGPYGLGAISTGGAHRPPPIQGSPPEITNTRDRRSGRTER